MDLRTRYLGLELKNPLIAGASPITHELDVARRLEDHGAAAIVMHSLFEEQIERSERSRHHHLSAWEDTHAEARSYLPEPSRYLFGPDAYLEQLRRLRGAVNIPVIASLNGVSEGGWVHYAKLMEDAGAHALELNVYYVATDPNESGAEVEARYLRVLMAIRAEVSIPIAIKLSPFFSAPVRMAKEFGEAGAQGLVLFNRFYQPDLDLEGLGVRPTLGPAGPDVLLLRLRWLAAVYGHTKADLAATGGVQSGRDALKALMAGANAVQLATAILHHGPAHLGKVLAEVKEFGETHEYESISQMIGSLSLARCPDPAAYERANYVKTLQSWRHGTFHA
ncbi:MAG: dihydroorotate dehydrogenase-like protein [Deltaproteobacteria bacterium]|jgi:dihydroorotate dehydrogenase (fumarate)|nr:dihydroorotate dehydrogenase-like protein [Deltaproteobacteria bacterium]